MHDYYNQCYSTMTEEYMSGLVKMAEKYNMYNNTLDEVSASVQQIVCNQPELSRDQHEANADICTQSCSFQ